MNILNTFEKLFALLHRMARFDGILAARAFEARNWTLLADMQCK